MLDHEGLLVALGLLGQLVLLVVKAHRDLLVQQALLVVKVYKAQ